MLPSKKSILRNQLKKPFSFFEKFIKKYPLTSQSTLGTCENCVYGYCPYFGATVDTEYTISDGYYCDVFTGCGSTAIPEPCEIGSKCQNGTIELCDGDTVFQPLGTQSKCLTCGPGFNCGDIDKRTECEAGVYCEDGINIEVGDRHFMI